MSAVGLCEKLGDEKLLDAVTGLSGSGPAYVWHGGVKSLFNRLGKDFWQNMGDEIGSFWQFLVELFTRILSRKAEFQRVNYRQPI